jgi:Protein of unknown function (DUF4230)
VGFLLRRGLKSGLVLVIGVIGLVAGLLVGAGVINGWSGWLPELRNPFQEETTDRSQPVVLESIQDLSRFTAATGNFEVIIDVERDRRFVPEFIFNERILFVAAGNVDAYVEFGGLTGDALVVDEANDSVQITLPPPQLEPPNLDPDRTYIFSQERGIANRLNDFFDDDPDTQQRMMQLGEQRIAEAAGASTLTQRAEGNTQKMLEGLLTSLGFETVTITFLPAPQ